MKSLIPELLEEFLGNARKINEYKSQVSFDCPECDNGGHKGNLEVNYEMGVYKCWACKDTNFMSGSLYNLVKTYGSPSNLETYLIYKPNNYNSFNKVDDRVLEIPKEFILLENDNTDNAIKIKNYLYERGIDDKTISKFKIHYSTTKGFKGRFFVPSYNTDNQMTYYVGRAIYDFMNPKYKNADLDKSKFIMFENLINWESDIYIVEGVLDAMIIPNAIPILGKYISPLLLKTLKEKAKGDVIICLDGDAQEDAMNLYIELDILELKNRIKNIALTGDWDLSEIHRKFGKRGVILTLRRASKINY